MQLLLPLDDRSRRLAEVHRRIERHFGPQGPFLQLDPVSQLVLALIGGRTRGAVSLAAFEALLTRFGSWAALRDAPLAEIEAAITPVTFAAVKAPRLKAALAAITDARGQPNLDGLAELSVADALARLERLPGVGRKVAAATLNFSRLRKAALVIDSHHLRILRRLHLVGRTADFRQAYDQVMPLLPADWSAAEFDAHHQLMKTLGQRICRHGAPLCRRCPLCGLCPSANAPPLTSRRHSAIDK